MTRAREWRCWYVYPSLLHEVQVESWRCWSVRLWSGCCARLLPEKKAAPIQRGPPSRRNSHVACCAELQNGVKAYERVIARTTECFECSCSPKAPGTQLQGIFPESYIVYNLETHTELYGSTTAACRPRQHTPVST